MSSAPNQATVDGEEHPALAHTPAQLTVSSPSADKPRELRRVRDKETTGSGSAPKRRKITPTPPPTPTLTPLSVPVPGAVPDAVPSPEIAEAQKVTQVVVPADQPSVPAMTSDSASPKSLLIPYLFPDLLYPDDINAATAYFAAAPRKIGMQHMELVYQATLRLQCRMCLWVVSSPPFLIPFIVIDLLL